MNKRQYSVLPNSAFANANASSDNEGGAFDNTGFGAWVESGFKSKAKRAAEAQAATNNLNTISTAGNTNTCTTNPACNNTNNTNTTGTSTDNTTTPIDNTNIVSTCYEGGGIFGGAFCKIAPNINFGQVPSLCSVLGINPATVTQTTTCGKKITTTKPTNWLLVIGVPTVLIGVGVFAYKKWSAHKVGKGKRNK